MRAVEEWRSLPGHPDLRGRAGHSASVVGKRIFVLGGRNGNDCFNDVWVFDMELECWQQLQSAPFPPRAYHSATLVAGNELWVIGGSDLKSMLGDVHVLNTDSLKWSIPTAKADKLRGTHAAVLHPVRKNSILVFGGYDGTKAGYLSDLAVLNTDSLKWEELRPSGKSPSGRGYHTLTAFGTRVALIGGKGEAGIITADVFSVYDAVENKWTSPKTKGVIPLPRASHKATLIGDSQIVVHGGRNGSKRLIDTYVLHVYPTRPTSTSSSYKWHLLSWKKNQHSKQKSLGHRLVQAGNTEGCIDRTVPEGRAAHSLLSRERSLYVFGGYGGNGKYFSNLYMLQNFPECPDIRRRHPLFPGLSADEPEKEHEIVSEGWRSTKRRRLQLSQQHEDHIKGVGDQVHEGNADAIEHDAALAANRIEERLRAILDLNQHTGRVEPAQMQSNVGHATDNGMVGDVNPCVLKSGAPNVEDRPREKDQRMQELETEMANLKSLKDRRIQDFENEIESLNSRLQASERRTVTLEKENESLQANAQVHLVELRNKEREFSEAVARMRISEQKSDDREKFLDEMKKANSIMYQENEVHRQNVQRLELELEKKTQSLQQISITYEKENALLLSEVTERKSTADRLFTELGAAKESARSLRETLDLLAKQFERENSKVDMLQKENEEHKRLHAVMSEECKQLISAREGADATVEKLREDLQAAQTVHAKDEIELAKLKDIVENSKEHTALLLSSKKKDEESSRALRRDNEHLRVLLREVEDFEQGQARNSQNILEKMRSARHYCAG